MTNKIKKIILNHLLSQNDWMQSRLINHKNKVIVIEISEFKLILKIDENGLLQSLNESEEIDCIIKLTVNDLINQVINNNNGNISIEGLRAAVPGGASSESGGSRGFCKVASI